MKFFNFPSKGAYNYDTIVKERNVSSDFGVVKNGEKYLRLNISFVKHNTRQGFSQSYFSVLDLLNHNTARIKRNLNKQFDFLTHFEPFT